jgi:hypothetical protein
MNRTSLRNSGHIIKVGIAKLPVKDRVEKCLNTVDYLLSTKRKELTIYERELKVETKLDALLPKAAIWLWRISSVTLPKPASLPVTCRQSPSFTGLTLLRWRK